MSQKARLSARLNLETAQAPWKELQAFFAKGLVLCVRSDLDLLQVAEQLSADNVALFESWMTQGAVSKVSDQQALQWFESDAVLWTVVIKPWILVQEVP